MSLACLGTLLEILSLLLSLSVSTSDSKWNFQDFFRFSKMGPNKVIWCMFQHWSLLLDKKNPVLPEVHSSNLKCFFQRFGPFQQMCCYKPSKTWMQNAHLNSFWRNNFMMDNPFETFWFSHSHLFWSWTLLDLEMLAFYSWVVQKLHFSSYTISSRRSGSSASLTLCQYNSYKTIPMTDTRITWSNMLQLTSIASCCTKTPIFVKPCTTETVHNEPLADYVLSTTIQVTVFHKCRRKSCELLPVLLPSKLLSRSFENKREWIIEWRKLT